MPKKVAKKNGAATGKMDFASFMKDMQKNDAFVDLGNKKEHFYRFGDYNLDKKLGGGLPNGQIYVFQGDSGTGKSLAALQIAKRVVDDGKRVMYFDVENKISRKALLAYGLADRPDEFIIFSVGTLEDALERMMQALESDLFGYIVIDSVDALVTDEQNDRDIHDGSKVGGYKAKMLSEWLGKVSQLAAFHDCSICLVQQVRDKLDSYGDPQTTSGGKAAGFYATVRLRFARNKKEDLIEDDRIAYQGVKITIMKMNQGALSPNPIETRFYVGENHPWGIDEVSSVFEEAKRLGILAPPTPKSYRYIPCTDLCTMLNVEPDEITFNGKGAVTNALISNKELFAAVAQLIEETEVPLTDLTDENDEITVDFEEDDE